MRAMLPQPHAAPPPPTTARFSTRILLALSDIKLAHSVFALPFAVLAAFLATPWLRPLPDGPSSLAGPLHAPDSALATQHSAPGTEHSPLTFAAQLALVVLCMVLARTWAMLVNRLADRRFDAANPRTARRAVASGALAARDAGFITAMVGGLFIAATGLFWVSFGNPWPLILSAPVLAWIAFYSFTKRFTALCHVFLGGALAASPIAAAIAVEPGALADTPAVWYLAGMVLCWVAGFDIIYALQDIEFDRETGLHSVPARLGAGAALRVSRGLHAAAAAFLVLAWRSDTRLGPLFGAGVAIVAALLITEHIILVRRGKAGLEMAFFTINGVVACVLGLVGSIDAAW